MVAKGALATKLQPLGDRIVVRPIKKEEVTKGGIVLPTPRRKSPRKAR
jgi:chaperonin GroES